MKIKKIVDVITDILPFGSIAKSIAKGAGSLLLKKAAKKVGIDIEPVLAEAANLAENDFELKKLLIQEEKDVRKHDLEFFGKYADLDPKAKFWRAMVRPLLSFGLVGLFILTAFLQIIQQIFPRVFGLEFMIIISPDLIVMAKWVVGFWFVGRTVEKIVDTVRNNK